MKKPTVYQNSVELKMETVLNTFRMLEKAGKLDAFVEECKRKNFVLIASAELVTTGKSALLAIDGMKAAGPDCPDCP